MRHCIVPAFVLVVVCGFAPADEKGGPPNVGWLAVDPGGHTGKIQDMHFTPDGKVLMTGSFADQTVQLWNTATAERIRAHHLIANLRGHYTDGTLAFALSPDAQMLAVGIGPPGESESPPKLRLYDLANDTMRLLPPPSVAVLKLAFSHDGKRLAGAHVFGPNCSVPVWDLSDPKTPLKYLRGHDKPVSDVAFSPQDSNVLATAGGIDNTIRIWNVTDRKEIRSYDHGADLGYVAWGPGGERLASVGSGVVNVWRVKGKALAATFHPKDLGPTCKNAKAGSVDIGRPVFEPKGGQLLIPWSIEKPGDWEAGLSSVGINGTDKGELLKHRMPNPPALSSDGRHVAFAHPTGSIQLVTVGEAGGRLLGRPPGQRPIRVAWGKDNRTIAWGPPGQIDKNGVARFFHSLNLNTLELHDHTGQEKPPEFIPAQYKALRWEVQEEKNAFVVLRGGKETGRFQGQCCAVGDLNGGGLLVRSGEKGGVVMSALPDLGGTGTAREEGLVRDIAISPNGKLALTGTHDNMMQVFRTEHPPQLLLTVYVVGEDWVAMTPQGYYAASPGADRMMGWVVSTNGVEHFIPVSRLRREIRRPDVIQRLLATRDLKEAMQQANKGTRRPQNPVVASVDKLLPPTVRLEATDRSKLPETVTVRATATATVADQKVEAVQLFLDGRPLADAKYVTRFKTPVASKERAEAVWTLKLPPGEHRLTALAMSKDSSSVSDPLDVSGPTTSRTTLGKLYQLCVGVSKYANDGKGDENKGLNLDYAADDAVLVDRVLRKSCSTLFEPAHQEVLTNDKATRDAILKAVSAIKERVAQTDLVVLHFACHGERDDEGKLWLLTHEADYRRPLDQTCLSAEKLKDVLADIPCKVLLILDACHAGAIGRMSASNDLTSLLTDEGGAFVLVAARERERAYEGVTVKRADKEVKLKNGLFTWMLGEALEGKAAADRYTGRVSAHDVYQYVLSEVQHWSGGKQHPYLGTPPGSRPLPLVWREK